MRRSRVTIIVVLLVALVASAALRQGAARLRGENDLRAGGVPLSRMNSYALALLLGGLRGPLVMFLWPSSEGQKSEKNVQDLDTKIEWIRLLQAEFDTVHIFQIWNKAYNISVLMANLPNKYATILDALDYAYNVDAERPNNVNILYGIGGIYFDKLGNSAEKRYYRQRVRDETMARLPLRQVTFPQEKRPEFVKAAQAAGVAQRRIRFVPGRGDDTLSVTLVKPVADLVEREFSGPGIVWTDRTRVLRDRNDPGWRRTELDPVLDADGNILPNFRDGDLKHIARFAPFPYGVSTLALAYNYHKQTQLLQREHNQHHAQLSDMVVDSRPSLALRDWSEEEWERGRLAELDAFGMDVPSDKDDLDWRINLEMLTAKVPLDQKILNRAAADEAVFSYRRSAQIITEALAEYSAHLELYRTNFDTYRSHMEAMEAQRSLVLGDADFLAVLLAPDNQRAALARTAVENYLSAIRGYEIHLLKYYITPDQATAFFPKGLDRTTIEDFARANPEQAEEVLEKIRLDVQKLGMQAQHLDEFKEYYRYIRRAQARVQTLEPLVARTAAAN